MAFVLFTKNWPSITVCVNSEVFVLFTANRPLISYWAATICVVSNSAAALGRSSGHDSVQYCFTVQYLGQCSVQGSVQGSVYWSGQ